MTDYRTLRPSNLNSPQFRHLKLLLYWVIFGILFYGVERVIPRRMYHTMWCPLDDRIPFCEWFMIPYMFWFVFLAGMHVYLLLEDIPAFRRMMRFIMLTYSAALVVFLLYPTRQLLRPAEFPRDNFLTRFIAAFYRFDTNTNVCPSLHCVGSMAVVFAAWDTERLRKGAWRVVFPVTGLLISVSTVFVKQHSVQDVFWGMTLSLTAGALVYILPRRGRKEAWRERTITWSRRSRPSGPF